MKRRRGYNRTERVNDVLQKAVAQILMQESDPRFRLVTITSVTVSKDISYAKVYVSLLMDEEKEIITTVQALNRAAKGVRYELAKMVKLRIVPEIKFVYDESTARGFQLSALIDSAVKKSEKK